MTNSGPIDAALQVSKVLPAAAANNTTDVLDLQAVAPNSDAWRLGRIRVDIPAMPNNTDSSKSVTLTLKAAPASLSSDPAPALPTAGSFVTPTCSQVISIPGVATTGSAATVAYFTLAFDRNGSTYQFYEFVQAVASGGGDNTAVSITYSWENS